MIEKDFSSPKKLGYSPFYARPRTLFGNDLILVDKVDENLFLQSRLNKFFNKKYNISSDIYSAVYQVELSKIWEKYYKHLSYPEFKYKLFNRDEVRTLDDYKIFEKFYFTSGIEISCNERQSKEDILSNYRLVLECFNNFVNDYRLSENQFTMMDLAKYLQKSLKIIDFQISMALSDVILNSVFEFSKITDSRFISERINSTIDKQRYQIHQDATLYNKFIMNNLNKLLSINTNIFSDKNKKIVFFCEKIILKLICIYQFSVLEPCLNC